MSYEAVNVVLVANSDRTRHEYDVKITDTGRTRVDQAHTLKSEDHKILRWNSNDAAVPMDIIRISNWQHKARHEAVLDDDDDRFIEEYRERMKNYVPSAEEKAEMRAAFGSGETIVNVFTGQKYRT